MNHPGYNPYKWVNKQLADELMKRLQETHDPRPFLLYYKGILLETFPTLEAAQAGLEQKGGMMNADYLCVVGPSQGLAI